MNLLMNQQMAETVDSVYIDLEARLMLNIVRHLQDWDEPIDTDRWLLQKLAEIGKLNRENVRIIAQMSGLSQTAAERMLNEMAEEAIKNIEPGIQHLTRQGLIEGAVDAAKSKNVKQVMKTLRTQARDTLNLTNTTMLHKAQEAFRNLAMNVAEEALSIMNNNTAAVITGAESRQQALRKAIKQFNAKGITGFVDKSGRNWTPEAYVNMVMRTTAGNTATEVQHARCRDCGTNLIAITSHAGARPKCAKDQGKIFDLNNGSGEVEDLKGRKIKYFPWNSSSYGEPDGILGINCHHSSFPFVPGINIQRYFPAEDMEANDKLYMQTQVQRALERDVRKQKRECKMFDELGDAEAFEEASVKLKAKEAKLKAYVDGHEHLHRRKDREQVFGFDKSISARAVTAKKHVDRYGIVRYNKNGNVVITDDWKDRKHASIPKTYRKNAVIETLEKKGSTMQVNRTYYDEMGRMKHQIHTGPHGNLKQHPYGQNGEHRHEYIWNEDGTLKARKTVELTEADRKENGDLL